jgi:hypothetical protein
VTAGVPPFAGTFARRLGPRLSVVLANGIAGTWTISADTDGVRLVSPASFEGSRTSPLTLAANSLQTVAFSHGLCRGLPGGTYRWARVEPYLVLTPLTDACDARVAVLSSGPWRAHP